jgi:glycerol-3-phosphate dehydrogenase (NAD(P)+)
VHLARAGASVRLWARQAEVARTVARERRNPWYLPGIEVPGAVEVTSADSRIATAADVVIVAVPSTFVGATLSRLAAPPAGAAVVSAAKGFEPGEHLRMSQVIERHWPGTRVAALSGPTFAREVGLGLPAAAVIASTDEGLAAALQQTIGTREFRLYTNRDLVGVEVGGAVKNVIAIATGLGDGLGLGASARAALVTRGLAEMTRLAVALGGREATLMGLAGLGDLVLTATGSLSRNRALGVALGGGQARAAVEGATRMIAEGVGAVRSAIALAGRHGVTLPICAEVSAVLFEGKPPAAALASLLDRALTREDAPPPGVTDPVLAGDLHA